MLWYLHNQRLFELPFNIKIILKIKMGLRLKEGSKIRWPWTTTKKISWDFQFYGVQICFRSFYFPLHSLSFCHIPSTMIYNTQIFHRLQSSRLSMFVLPKTALTHSLSMLTFLVMVDEYGLRSTTIYHLPGFLHH